MSKYTYNERDVEKTVNDESINRGWCPNCTRSISRYGSPDFYNYEMTNFCPFCGQKLKWKLMTERS